MPYSQLSIRALSNRAGVNHNTFYRHFENMNDLAQKAFEQSIPKDIPALLKDAVRNGELGPFSIFDQKEFRDYTKRAQQLAKSDSLQLTQIFQDSLKRIWLEHLEIDEDQLTEDEILEIDFILGGFVAAVRANNDEVNAQFIRRLLKKPLYSGVISTFIAIGNRQHEDTNVAEGTVGKA